MCSASNEAFQNRGCIIQNGAWKMPFFSTAQSCAQHIKSSLFVFVCFVVIAGVSAFDTWSAAANSEILTVEKNPICTILLRMDPENRSYFVFAKSMGAVATILVLGLLLMSGYRHAKLVTASIAFFQFSLLIYICFSDPRLYGLPNFFLYLDSPESIFIIE